MSACIRFFRHVFWGALVVSLTATGQELMDRAQIASKKQLLQNEREAIAATYEIVARQCWQKFMVNDCLQAAREQRRQGVALIDKQEQALRAAQRALTVIERRERLDAKQPELQVPYDLRR